MTCLWNPEKFCLGNPEFLGFEIRNPTNPESTRLSTEILYLKSGIHGVASRISDCLEIPYMGRGTYYTRYPVTNGLGKWTILPTNKSYKHNQGKGHSHLKMDLS